MAVKNQRKRKNKHVRSLRASVTFPHELYRSLEDVARGKKVSVAWVVREAAQEYVKNKWPLFAQQ